MGSQFRPIYEDDALAIVRESVLWSQSSITSAVHGIGVSASVVVPVFASNYMITLNDSNTSLTAINVDINFANLYYRGGISGVETYTIDKLLNQPSYQKRNKVYYNPSFSANWVSLTTIAAGNKYIRFVDVPTRWLRLRGDACTASNFSAFVFTDSMVQGS